MNADALQGSGANTNRLGDDGEMPQFVPVEELFKGRHFDQEIVVLNVRWYLSYKLSYRDLVAMMAERGIDLAHTTILRWVQHYTPEFQKRWNRFARTVGGSWRMDETYVRVKGQWTYLYRAVDKTGQTVDFYLSRKRDVNAAKAFLRKAMKNQRVPTKITLDAYAASHRAVAELKQSGELPKRVKVRSRALVQIRGGPDSGRFARFDWDGSDLCGQGSLPDLRHPRRPSSQLADLELTLLNLLCQLDASDRDYCRWKALQSQHRAEALFHPSMVLLDQVVQVLTATDLYPLR